ncbi:OLC1v1036239C1 [Oldenlandia corymbosa var. corymbosa]|uniref:OLC1v1036239C1 n=1 Tax=Oldenlandia corymbosa var. corymbosa TaxID=529605 RepID=A0AAV1CWS7_OLDCO|nr:OLC1v1036239C1 [Oldenlandia corymbosa var. corymbosa]
MALELVFPKDVVPSSSVVEDFSSPESQTKKVDDGNIKSVSDPSSISIATKTVNHQVPIVNSGVPMNSHVDFGNESVESEATVSLKAIVDRAPSVPNVAAQRYITDINGMIDTKSIYFFIVVRVMTLWKVPETSKSNKIKSMEMTLVDAQKLIGKKVNQLKIAWDWLSLLNDNAIPTGSLCQLHLDRDSLQPGKIDVKFGFSVYLDANIGLRYLLELNPNNALRCGINPQYFRAIGWLSNQAVSLMLDDKHKQRKFEIYTQKGQLYFKLRVFNSEGYCCDQDISALDSSKGEVDTIDYIQFNGDQNTFNVVMNTDVIQCGKLEIPWHIVRRLEIQDYSSLIIYYDGELVVRMGRIYLSDYPNRFIIEGDIEYMMGLKKIPTGIKLGFRIDARKVVNKEHLILEVL